MWSDMLLEEQLLEKGQQINLDRTSRKQPNVSRGPESYLMPQDEFQRKQSRNANQKKKNEVFDVRKLEFLGFYWKKCDFLAKIIRKMRKIGVFSCFF